jgi:DNA gyrase/topoisomerase IV subunit B
MMPQLIDEGRVFICDAPLYSAYHKAQRYFGATFDECYSQMPKGAPKEIVTRAKGWGELPPEVLQIIAFDPQTRNLIKVLPPKDKEDLAYFKHILGSDTAGRKELLGLRG